MAHIIQAIKAINPNAVVTVSGNDVDQIEWQDGTTPIAKADILAKQVELTAAENVEITQKETDKNNAVSKLEALGLTSSEITELLK
jgi:phosphosulfolactate synthase (CoM biosynthesis protein A)|tara:strand:+ start:461 stop:718 length:258 start_codon:yes stop_codon:yes gene_type:complete